MEQYGRRNIEENRETRSPEEAGDESEVETGSKDDVPLDFSDTCWRQRQREEKKREVERGKSHVSCVFQNVLLRQFHNLCCMFDLILRYLTSRVDMAKAWWDQVTTVNHNPTSTSIRLRPKFSNVHACMYIWTIPNGSNFVAVLETITGTVQQCQWNDNFSKVRIAVFWVAHFEPFGLYLYHYYSINNAVMIQVSVVQQMYYYSITIINLGTTKGTLTKSDQGSDRGRQHFPKQALMNKPALNIYYK